MIHKPFDESRYFLYPASTICWSSTLRELLTKQYSYVTSIESQANISSPLTLMYSEHLGYQMLIPY